MKLQMLPPIYCNIRANIALGTEMRKASAPQNTCERHIPFNTKRIRPALSRPENTSSYMGTARCSKMTTRFPGSFSPGGELFPRQTHVMRGTPLALQGPPLFLRASVSLCENLSSLCHALYAFFRGQLSLPKRTHSPYGSRGRSLSIEQDKAGGRASPRAAPLGRA